MSEKKTFEVAVEPGARPGQKIVLRGEAGISEPGLEPGDVVLVVAQIFFSAGVEDAVASGASDRPAEIWLMSIDEAALPVASIDSVNVTVI